MIEPLPPLRVSNPPPKPLMIWDGDCHFCRAWIERWKASTSGRVEYATYQSVAQHFPEIQPEHFQRAVALIETDGSVHFAARAVFHSLGYRRRLRWLEATYDRIPAFAAVSELAYAFISRHRQLASAITRLLWGRDVRPPTYLWARRWFLRALGVVYLIAFISFWVQVDGLVGANGVLPVNQFLPAVHQALGSKGFALLPTLCWFSSSNTFLHFLCGGGVVCSLLLIVEIGPIVCLIALFVLYLSVTVAGQTFLSFQWDILLLETGFLAIFFAPSELRHRHGHVHPVSRVALFLLKLLLFKLMVMSGVVKLTSGDDCWWKLTALDYHYWSQPLPTAFAWWADKHPQWFKQFSVAFCLFVEIIVPVFMWAPRRPRLIACGLLIFLQLAIAITGNYCFFNLLTIGLCLLLIDDAAVPKMRRARASLADPAHRAPAGPASPELRPPKHVSGMDGRTLATAPLLGSDQRSATQKLTKFAAVVVLVVTLPLNGWLIFSAFKPDAVPPRLVATVNDVVEPFRIVNGYGLFRVMTKDRREIVIEGSSDGIDWKPYEFRWKPGDVKRVPGWCAPHQPRLDWQMWFAALGAPQQNPWFLRLVLCLLQGKNDVSRLLEYNPFTGAPPRYVRASFFRYRFTSTAERRQSGAWWKREELGAYFPEVSLQDFRQE